MSSSDAIGDSPRRRWRLALILLGGFAVRVACVTWGLPLDRHTSYYHADEVKAWGTVVDFPGNYLTNDNYLYGTTLQTVVGTLLIPVKAAMTEDMTPDDRYRLTAIVAMRCFSILLGTLAILLTYRFAAKVFDETTALCAAAFLAVAPGHALFSAFCNLDVAMSFLLMAGFLLARRALERGRNRDWLLLGLTAGALLGTKFTGALFLAVPLFLAAWNLVSPAGRPATLGSTAKGLSIVLLTASAVFAVTNLHVVLSPDEYVAFMLKQKADWYDRPASTLAAIGSAWATALSTSLGWPIAVLAAIGPLCIRRPELKDKIAALAFVAGYLLFWRAYVHVNFLAYVAPLLCVFAGRTAAIALLDRRVSVRVASRCAVGAAVGLSLGVTVLALWQRGHDNRTAAARFIEETFPPGTTIGIASDAVRYHWRHHQWRYPRVDFERYPERHFLKDPDVIVVTSFELNVMKSALESPRLRSGDVWDPRFKSDWYENRPPAPIVFAFYRELFEGKRYRLLRSFENRIELHEGLVVPPDVYIYVRIDR